MTSIAQEGGFAHIARASGRWMVSAFDTSPAGYRLPATGFFRPHHNYRRWVSLLSERSSTISNCRFSSRISNMFG